MKLCLLAACLFGVARAWAGSAATLPLGSRPLEPGLAGRDDVILFSDFEEPDWFRLWGQRKVPERCETVDADAARKFEPLSGKALRIKVDKDGHYGASLDFAFQKELGEEPEEIYFRYYLRLGDDWDPTTGGGKLPGIAGTYGRAGWGGRKVNGSDGWSARGLFRGRKDGKTPIGYYCYHVDMKGIYGSEWIWERDRLGYLENNRWYCVEQHVQLNTPGQNDGILRGWVDGQLAFEKTDLRFRDVPALKIEKAWIDIYLGGTWTAPSDHHLFIDHVVVARKPIGTLQLKPAPNPAAAAPAPVPAAPVAPKLDAAPHRKALVEALAKTKPAADAKAWLKVMGQAQEVGVAGFDDRGVTIRLRGNGLPVAWKDLNDEDVARLAEACRPGDAEALLHAAVLAAASGNVSLREKLSDQLVKLDAARFKTLQALLGR
ncbi:MAG: hypothetical protein M5U26_08825 [Planctomycetota bacterium]|nr:hypothetical protein [Planctomycetota bacterium]